MITEILVGRNRDRFMWMYMGDNAMSIAPGYHENTLMSATASYYAGNLFNKGIKFGEYRVKNGGFFKGKRPEWNMRLSPLNPREISNFNFSLLNEMMRLTA